MTFKTEKMLMLQKRKHYHRCQQIPGYNRNYDKALNEAIYKGPVDVEKLAQEVLKKMNAKDPCATWED